MRRIVLPSGKSTSQIGLGCGVLVGGLSSRLSYRMVEMALALGVTHFDVAPLYGMGLAENVLGDVIGDDAGITIATKVGLSRPQYSYLRDLARILMRTPLRSFPAVKQRLLALRGRQHALSAPSNMVFDQTGIRASFEDSLRRLRRSQVEWLLAHDPAAESGLYQTEATFKAWVVEGLVSSYGVGSVVPVTGFGAFGSVRQGPWHERLGCDVLPSAFRSHFGVIRGGGDYSPPRGFREARGRLESALSERPNDLILVSAATPARLRELLSDL